MSPRVLRGITLAGILLVAANLRTAVVALSPLLHEIQHTTGLSSAAAGLLTTLPVLCFGAFSPLAPLLARRYGIERVVFGAVLLLAAAIAVRLVPDLFALFAGTFVAGIAIAIGNVLLPALIKRDFPGATGITTAGYVVALTLSAAIAAALTVPLQTHFGLDWRGALAVWAILALIAAVAWLPQLRYAHHDAGAVAAPPALFRDRVAWFVTLFMGLQSWGFYTVVAWLPAFYVAHGLNAAAAGGLLSLGTIVGVPAVLLVPVVCAKVRDQTPYVWGVMAIYAVALLGLLVAPLPLAALWVMLLGFAQNATFGMAVTFIMLRSPDAHHAAELSSMAQTVGYLIAATGPFLFGALLDASGGWTAPVAMLLLLIVPLLVTGIGAARPRSVGVPVPAVAV